MSTWGLLKVNDKSKKSREEREKKETIVLFVNVLLLFIYHIGIKRFIEYEKLGVTCK